MYTPFKINANHSSSFASTFIKQTVQKVCVHVWEISWLSIAIIGNHRAVLSQRTEVRTWALRDQGNHSRIDPSIFLSPSPKRLLESWSQDDCSIFWPGHSFQARRSMQKREQQRAQRHVQAELPGIPTLQTLFLHHWFHVHPQMQEILRNQGLWLLFCSKHYKTYRKRKKWRTGMG